MKSAFSKLILIAVICAAALTAACSTTPQSPAQAVYAVEVSYAAALTVAVQYKQLPACGQPASPPLCSNAAIVASLQKADDVAFETLQTAQSMVRMSGAGANLQTAIAAAERAVGLFTTITSKLGVK